MFAGRRPKGRRMEKTGERRRKGVWAEKQGGGTKRGRTAGGGRGKAGPGDKVVERLPYRPGSDKGISGAGRTSEKTVPPRDAGGCVRGQEKGARPPHKPGRAPLPPPKQRGRRGQGAVHRAMGGAQRGNGCGRKKGGALSAPSGPDSNGKEGPAPTGSGEHRRGHGGGEKRGRGEETRGGPAE